VTGCRWRDGGRGILPTFVIVGAQKAGTTSLWAYLGSHPQVFVSPEKEPGFFCREISWDRGLGWYEGLFAEAGEARAVGEASTYYTMYPFFAGVPERMASVVPDAKIVYVVRDPIARMRSSYVQLLAEGTEYRSLRTALLLDARYAVLSRYVFQLEQYLGWFPESNVLVVTAEDLRGHPVDTVDRVCRFLGVDSGVPLDLGTEHNVSAGKRALRSPGRLLRRAALDHRVPERVRRHLFEAAALPGASRPVHDDELVIDDDLRSRLADLVRDDVELLRRWMDPSFDGWGLLEQGRMPPEGPTTSGSDSGGHDLGRPWG
jgi:hypothetical protein